MNMRKATFVAGLVALPLLLWGCGDDGGGAAQLAAIIDSRVVNIDDEPDLTLQSVAGVEYVIVDSDPATGAEIVAGTILASAEGNGHLRFVDSLVVAGGTITAQTSQATLVDAVIQGEFGDTAAVDGSKGGAKAISHDLTGTVIFDGAVGPVDFTLDIPTGSVSLDADVDLDGRIRDRQMEYFRAVVEGTLTFDFDVRVSASAGGSATKEVTVPGPAPVVMVQWIPATPPFPVVEVIYVDFVVGVDVTANVAGTVQAGVNSTATVKVGAEYTGGAWQPVMREGFDISMSPPQWSVDGDVTVRGYVRPEVKVMFFDLAGPTLSLEPYLQLAALLQAPPPRLDWSLDAGIAGYVGFELGILDATLASYSAQVFDWSTNIGAGTFVLPVNNPPAVTVYDPSGPQTGDVDITYDLADADGDTCSIEVEYQGGSVGTTWTTATVAGTTTTLTPNSGLLSITWNSATNEPGQTASDYKIRIRAHDGTEWGAWDETLAFAVDNNQPPTASFTVSPPSGSTATTFSVDASGCSDAEDATAVLQVRWDWENDGSWDTSYSTTKTATHQYATIGSKTIKVEVMDTGGLTDTTTRSVSVGPALLTDVQSVAAGSDHTVALKTDGTVWAWGRNSYGQLGDGTTTDSYTPVQVVAP